MAAYTIDLSTFSKHNLIVFRTIYSECWCSVFFPAYFLQRIGLFNTDNNKTEERRTFYHLGLQTDRQTDRPTDRQTDRRTDWIHNDTLYAPQHWEVFCITVKNDLGRLASSALPHYCRHYSPFPSNLRVFILIVRVVQHFFMRLLVFNWAGKGQDFSASLSARTERSLVIGGARTQE